MVVFQPDTQGGGGVGHCLDGQCFREELPQLFDDLFLPGVGENDDRPKLQGHLHVDVESFHYTLSVSMKAPFSRLDLVDADTDLALGFEVVGLLLGGLLEGG